MDYQIHHHIILWLREAGRLLRLSWDGPILVQQKTTPDDLVTEMDQIIEKYLVDQIHHHYPTHQVLSEEGFGNEVTDLEGYVWMIDPIDGTMNYVKKQADFAVMIGLYCDGEPLAGYIYDVMKEELYYGIQGEGLFLNDQPLEPQRIEPLSESIVLGNTRMFVSNHLNSQALLDRALCARTYGSAALSIIAVLKGDACAYLSRGIYPWDFGAGYAMCRAIDFPVSRPDGSALDLLDQSPVLFSHPNTYQEIIKLLNEKKEDESPYENA